MEATFNWVSVLKDPIEIVQPLLLLKKTKYWVYVAVKIESNTKYCITK